MPDTLRQQLDTRVATMRAERDSSWLEHWRDLNRYILPLQGRFLASDRNNGRKRNEKIANECATFSAHTTQRGMMHSITNPARPWLKLETPWPDLNKQSDVRAWLETMGERILNVFQKSNVYTELPKIYLDLIVYGTAACVVNRDPKSTIRLESFPIGSYCLATDGTGRVNACCREWQMTGRQLVDRFGVTNCSMAIQQAHETGIGLDAGVDVIHVLELNPDWNPKSPLAMHKRFRSVYYEKGAEDGRFLQISGYDTFRILAPRWDVMEGDAYGLSPAMEILGTVKGLQALEKQSLQLLAKVINPPLNVPAGLKGDPITQLAGGVNHYSGLDSGVIRPAYEITNAPLVAVQAKIQDYEARIRKALFEDVFLIITQGKPDVTAEEIRARLEEKIQSIGPILLRLNDELLDNLVEITFEIMSSTTGMIPPAPEGLVNKPLTIEYISEMAKAMKIAGLGGIDRAVGFITGFARFKPAILDALNEDEIADVYSDLSGAPVSIINDAAVRKMMRAQRQAKQAQAENIQKAAASAEIAHKMSQTVSSGDNLLGSSQAQISPYDQGGGSNAA